MLLNNEEFQYKNLAVDSLLTPEQRKRKTYELMSQIENEILFDENLKLKEQNLQLKNELKEICQAIDSYINLNSKYVGISDNISDGLQLTNLQNLSKRVAHD